MAGGGLGLSRTATALKPLVSSRRGQGATPTPPIHVDAYNSRKMSSLCVHPYAAHDGILFLCLPNFTTNLSKHTHRQANVLSILQWRPIRLQLNDVMLTPPI